MPFSDQDIIETLQRDKPEGVRKLFESYYRPLLLHAREYLQQEEEARDIVQELFLRLWERDYLARVTPDRLAAYLYTAVRNACQTRGRSYDPLRAATAIKSVDLPWETLPPVDEEQATRAISGMNRLPQDMRAVVEHIVIRDLKYKETATRLGLSINTVKYLLKEGIKRIRRDMRPPSRSLLLLLTRGLKRLLG
jgi:RNA polymerase sigma-70 factor (ECF subfamily)